MAHSTPVGLEADLCEWAKGAAEKLSKTEERLKMMNLLR